jgi:uncharacterized membrane protein YhaH (DUF805 family)
MIKLLINPLLKYGSFSGRATRREFWSFAALFSLITVSAHFFDLRDGEIIPVAGGMGVFELGTFLALLLPFVAVGARRLHDSGRSGWWMLFLYIPYLAFVSVGDNEQLMIAAAGGLVVGAFALIALFAVPGSVGQNAFGPDPRIPTSVEG